MLYRSLYLALLPLALAACQGSNPYVASSNPCHRHRPRRPPPSTPAPTRHRHAIMVATAAGVGATTSYPAAWPVPPPRSSPTR